MHKNQSHQKSSSDNKTQLSRINGIKDLEELRKPYELAHHWELRKEFLKIHADKFDPDRLICLSNVFINVECMGLTYPEEVMKLVKELGKSVRGLETYKYQFEQDEPELPRKHSSNSRRHH
jgi:hypothetical protein